jgi:hypothetical protein
MGNIAIATGLINIFLKPTSPSFQPVAIENHAFSR